MPAPLPLLFYYDGDCGFCTLVVGLLTKFDFSRQVSWVPYQSLSEPPEGLTWQDLDREAYLEGNRRRECGFYAFRRLCLILPPLLPFAPFFWLLGVNLSGEAVYRWVARNRGRFSAACGR